MKEHFFIRCIVFCIALVDATDRHLRGSTFDTARLSLNQLILGGLPIAQEDCPLSDPAKDCTSEPLEVVSCRSCEYDNACLATGAGFLYRRDCLFSFEVNDDPDNFGNNLNCRAIPPTSLCLDLIDPVICNDCGKISRRLNTSRLLSLHSTYCFFLVRFSQSTGTTVLRQQLAMILIPSANLLRLHHRLMRILSIQSF